MAVSYTDDQIDALVRERKPLPADWQGRTRMRAKRGHEQRDLDLIGDAGTKFRMILRQSRINGLDFSIILAVIVPQSTQVFRLRRYNDRSHEHTNQIEHETFYDFHIHFATERYQELGRARTRTPGRPIVTGLFVVRSTVCSRTPTSAIRRRHQASCGLHT